MTSAVTPSLTPVRHERRHVRYRCAQRLCLRYRSRGQDFSAFGRCMVIGKGGIGAYIPADIEIGQVTALEISLNSLGTQVTIRGQVKNRRGSNYGFQFMEVTENAVASLRALFRPEAAV